MRRALTIPALLCSLLCGCVSLNWSRGNVNEPIADAALASLRPGEADLTQCLSTLGAPNLVWEYKIDGLALAYAWVDSGGWGAGASYSFFRYAPAASFNFAPAAGRVLRSSTTIGVLISGGQMTATSMPWAI